MIKLTNLCDELEREFPREIKQVRSFYFLVLANEAD